MIFERVSKMIGATSAYGAVYTGSVYTRAAADNRINANVNPGAVEPVKAVPKTFGNEDTERVKKTPAQMDEDRNRTFDMMKAGSSRNADNINGFKPFEEEKSEAQERLDKQLGIEKCETCENRKYVDGSNEADVSFKSPGHIDPSSAASVVSAHEHQHVANAIQEGNKPDAELVSVSVSLKTDTCPECGRTYVSGGVTHTQIKHTADGSDMDKAMAVQRGEDPENAA